MDPPVRLVLQVLQLDAQLLLQSAVRAQSQGVALRAAGHGPRELRVHFLEDLLHFGGDPVDSLLQDDGACLVVIADQLLPQLIDAGRQPLALLQPFVRVLRHEPLVVRQVLQQLLRPGEMGAGGPEDDALLGVCLIHDAPADPVFEQEAVALLHVRRPVRLVGEDEQLVAQALTVHVGVAENAQHVARDAGLVALRHHDDGVGGLHALQCSLRVHLVRRVEPRDVVHDGVAHIAQARGIDHDLLDRDGVPRGADEFPERICFQICPREGSGLRRRMQVQPEAVPVLQDIGDLVRALAELFVLGHLHGRLVPLQQGLEVIGGQVPGREQPRVEDLCASFLVQDLQLVPERLLELAGCVERHFRPVRAAGADAGGRIGAALLVRRNRDAPDQRVGEGALPGTLLPDNGNLELVLLQFGKHPRGIIPQPPELDGHVGRHDAVPLQREDLVDPIRNLPEFLDIGRLLLFP